jgi:hypothetical protein
VLRQQVDAGGHLDHLKVAGRAETSGTTVNVGNLAIAVLRLDATPALSRTELLQRTDVTEIRIPRSSTYKQPMSYRALPLAGLLGDLRPGPDEVIEIVATDGFVTLLPPDLVFAKGRTASVPEVRCAR